MFDCVHCPEIKPALNSGRLSESPSNSMDVHQATVRSNSTSDSDLEGETDPLNWQELVTEEELKKLNPNEKKRQEVINGACCVWFYCFFF